MKTYLYRASNLSLFWHLFQNGSQFLAPAKKCRFLRFILTKNMVPITGRANSLFVFFEFSRPK